MTLAKTSNNRYPTFPSLIDRFFEGDMMDWNNWNFAGANSTLPAVNIRENDDGFMIEVAAPGMAKEDFKVDYDNGRLTISSKKEIEKNEKQDDKISRREFAYESFQRSFNVSERLVNADEIAAKYDAGILYITLPKREEVKPKPAKSIAIN